jgi:hypothetical protein
MESIRPNVVRKRKCNKTPIIAHAIDLSELKFMEAKTM